MKEHFRINEKFHVIMIPFVFHRFRYRKNVELGFHTFEVLPVPSHNLNVELTEICVRSLKILVTILQ